ncbi:MAG: hypothetical protein MUF10_05440 [Thermoanaerobaculaceae bacterium]|jgi:hypothetical protein|nr:hypothetical protein [Thermoanaerobaculaceae bacterium]
MCATRPTVECRVIVAWAATVCITLSLLAATNLASGAAGGRGVAFRDGRYILIHGNSVREVSQLLGQAYYVLRFVTVCSIGLAVAMLVVVLVRGRTFRIDRLLTELPAMVSSRMTAVFQISVAAFVASFFARLLMLVFI